MYVYGQTSEQLTFACADPAQHEQPGKPPEAKHPLIPLPPVLPKSKDVVAEPPQQQPPASDDAANGAGALGLDDGRARNLRVAIAARHRRRLGGQPEAETDEEGGEQGEDGGEVGEEGVVVEGVAAGLLLDL